MVGSSDTRAGRAATTASRRGFNHARRTAATAARIGAAAVVAALLATVAAPPASAQFAAPDQSAALGGPSLTQRGIPAEATAENGVLARERAHASGRRLAWEKLAAEAGAPAGSLSDSRIEAMVASIVIEQERITNTRYAGRITVNFDAGRVRGALGSRGGAVAGGEAAAGRGDAGALPAVAAPPQGPPASNWVEAVATYRSLSEWIELRRRLGGAAPVASVDVVGIAVDAARLRIGLRAPAPAAAGDLAALGIALAPVRGAAPGETWRVGLAGGG